MAGKVLTSDLSFRPLLNEATASLSSQLLSAKNSTLLQSSPAEKKPQCSYHSAHMRRKKVISLSGLCIFTCLSALVMHRSRQVTTKRTVVYSPATSLLCAEILKFIVSVFLYSQEDKSAQIITEITPSPMCRSRQGLQTTLRTVRREVSWTFAIPSLLYVAQGFLQIISTTFISALAYQSTSQIKIVTAAIVSSWFLKTRLRTLQWLATGTLLLGVLIVNNEDISTLRRSHVSSVQFHNQITSPFYRVRSHPAWDVRRAFLNQNLNYISKARFIIGFCAVVLSCFLGSFAGVYVENIIKSQNRKSLWQLNAQLSLCGMATSAMLVTAHCISKQILNPFHNFTLWAWATVALRVTLGFVVAFVLKYADSILKGFATSLSIILTLAFEITFCGKSASVSTFVGSFLICGSALLYSLPNLH